MKKMLILLNLLIFLSLSSFSWEVFFNSPPDPLQLKDSVLKIIDLANKTIYISIYSLNDEDVISSLKAKSFEGVDVKIVMEGENYVKDIKMLSDLDIVADPLDNGLMHSKYIVVDGKYVWFGSTNLTNSGFYHDFNNSIIFESPELASIFEKDFQKMREGYFEGAKDDEFATLSVDNVEMEVCFSPSEKTFESIIKMLKSAKSEVDVAIYSFSDPRIALTLAALDEKGVKVRVLADESWNSSSYSFIPKMKEFSFVRKYRLSNGLFHHKYIIIDPKGRDPVVITGSYNLTLSAELKNDETLVIIHSKEIALRYLENFESLYISK